MTTQARIRLAAALIGASAALGLAPSRAETAPVPPAGQVEAPAASKPAALTQARIDGLLAAQPELARIDAGSADKPDPKVEARAQAQAEAIVKRHGFSSLDAFQDATESVDAVLEGIDPQTRAYVGVTPLLRKQLAAVEADKTLPAKDKAEAARELKAAIAAGEPGGRPSEADIALVIGNYDRLSAAMAGDGKP